MKYVALLAAFVLCVYVVCVGIPTTIYLFGTDILTEKTLCRVIIGGVVLATSILAGAVGWFVIQRADEQ